MRWRHEVGAVVAHRRRRRAALAALLALGLLASPPVPAAATGDAPGPAAAYAGRPLADVLRLLQERGLAIVFTSELVRPGMAVAAEPAAAAPRAILDEVLAPHGLAAREGPGGVLVVVAAPAGGAAASVVGRVVPRGGGEGLAGAVVGLTGGGLETPADAEGRFAIGPLAPGRYDLVARAPGYLDERVTGVTAGGGGAELVIRLRPQPFVEDEIVVRPSRVSLLHERPDASFALGREEIANLPHLGDDLFRAVSLFPGTAANDVTARFSVHGGRRDEVRILLDGQELYDAYHLVDYDSALSIVPARVLAGASLSTGAYPVSQGDRMSGVLDLRTADPGPERHDVLALSVLDAQASSAGRFGAGRGGWLVSARRGSLDIAGEAIGDESPAFWDLLGKAELDTGGRGLWTLHLLTARDELEVDRAEEEDFERLENDYGRDYAWVTHQALPSGRLLLETAASWARIERDRASAVNEEEGRFTLRDRRDLEVLGLAQSWSLQLATGHLARWGAEGRRYDAFFDYAKRLEPAFVILAPSVPPRPTEHAFAGSLRSDHLGVWASDRWSAFGHLTAEAGARYDRHTATGDTLLSPRLNLAWRLGERAVLRAAWGRFFQSQRPYELAVEDAETALRPAELSEHAVLGYEALLAAHPLGLEAVRVELYRRDVADPRPRHENLLEALNFFPEIEPDRVRIAPERSTAEGVEALLRGSAGARFDWWLAYAWARAEDRLGGARVPRALDQRHTLTLDLDLRLPAQWNLNLAWRYHSGWPTTPVAALDLPDPEGPDDPDDPEDLTAAPAAPPAVAVFGPLYSDRLPTYHRLDLRASRGWRVGRGRLTFFLDAQNLYDRRNLAGFDLVLDEDEGTVHLEGEHWPGFFPSLGIIWER